MEIRKFCHIIMCYGNPEKVIQNTLKSLQDWGTEKDIYFLCSTDDALLPEYKRLFGDSVYVFSKTDVEEKLGIDTMQCYHGAHSNRSAPLWSRNIQFECARHFGYRYFITWDDDINKMRIRYVCKENGKEIINGKSNIEIRGKFDPLCEMYFRMLDSAPWLFSVAFSQGGDYVGGKECAIMNKGYKWKCMNSFFCDTEKEYRYYGQLNEDVNAYLINQIRGRKFLTLAGACIDQLPTQKSKGGMTELYQLFGTYFKSIFSVLIAPSGVKIIQMGNSASIKKDATAGRIHHRCLYDYISPAVVREMDCKNILDWEKVMDIDFSEKTIDFTEKEEYIPLIENTFLCNTLDNF